MTDLCQIFILLRLGISHFIVPKKQSIATHWYFDVSRIKVKRILGTYCGLNLVNMSKYTMQITVCSQRQSKSVSTSGCFAHLVRERRVSGDGGNCTAYMDYVYLDVRCLENGQMWSPIHSLTCTNRIRSHQTFVWKTGMTWKMLFYLFWDNFLL